MTEKVHLIPVGFDFERLYLPITRGELDADRAILLNSRDDPDLVSQSIDRLNRELSAHDIEVEKQQIELYDFGQIYETGYDLLSNLLGDSECEVFINVSSMPRTVGFGLAGAAYDLILEKPPYRDRVHVYYAAPEEYLAPDLVDALEDDQSIFRILERFISTSAQRDGEQFIDVLEEAHASISEAASQVEYLSRSGRQTTLESTQGDIYDYLPEEEAQEVRDFFNSLDVLTDRETIETVDEALEGLPLEQDEKNQLQVFIDFLENIQETESAPFSEVRERLKSIEHDIQSRQFERRDIESRVQERRQAVDSLLRDIDRYGLTAGARRLKDEQRHVEFSPPLESLERPAEFAILYVLSRVPKVESRSKLASLLTDAVVEQVEEEPQQLVQYSTEQPAYRSLVRELTSRDLSSETEDQLRELLHRDELPSDLTEFVASDLSRTIERESLEEAINSRVQYNISSLAEKGYIRRESHGRRTAIILTDAGELWTRTHDVDSQFKQDLPAFLSKELIPYIVDQMVDWHESNAELNSYE